MPMKKIKPAANPDAYVAALTGWRRACVEMLRAAVLKGGYFEEIIKWGHLVYFSHGPCLLIRAEGREGFIRLLAWATAEGDRVAAETGRQIRNGHAGDSRRRRHWRQSWRQNSRRRRFC